LIVGDAEEPKRVLDCSPEAGERGVRREMTIRRALTVCPEALVLPPDPVLYHNRWQDTLAAFEEISPEVEDQAWGRAYLNVGGLLPHYGDEDAICRRIIAAVQESNGLLASVGLANGKLPSLAAAFNASPGDSCVIASGSEPDFLAPLSTSLLLVEPEVVARLRLLGLTQIGDVARLTLPELQSQFGFAGKRLWQLSRGIDDEPLYPRPKVESLTAGLSFEAPVAGVEMLVAASRQLLGQLLQPLHSRAVREFTLQAELASGRGWQRRLVFREAVSEQQRLVFLLKSVLQNSPPPMAVRSLTLCLSGLAGETGKQMFLGERGRLQRQLEECIRQLKARYGYSPIYRCVDVESWSVIPEERQILVESDA
jgi:nucleotidyltransferase/DNA polymerase involved in DNA repair